jgi:hypothetical protein
MRAGDQHKKGMAMTKFLIAAALGIACSTAAWAATPSNQSEEAGVREALNHYLQGQATGDGDHFRRAFYPEAKLLFVRDGKLTSVTSEEFAARANGTPAADEAQRRRWIESIDTTGDAAIAKLVLDYPDVRFVDYMTLLKVDGSWRIINKSFYADRKPKS